MKLKRVTQKQRVFYSGEPLPPLLDAAMRSFDARARSQRLLDFVKGTELG